MSSQPALSAFDRQLRAMFERNPASEAEWLNHAVADGEDYLEVGMDTMVLEPFEVPSMLLALERAPGVVERAAFNDDGRCPPRVVEIAVCFAATERVHDAGTWHLLDRDGPVAVQVASHPSMQGPRFSLEAFAPSEELAQQVVHELVTAGCGDGLLYRRSAVRFDPAVSYGYEFLGPVDETMGVDASVRRELQVNLVTPLLGFDELGDLVPNRGVLLYGPPGSGKSTAVSVVRTALDGRITVIVATPNAIKTPAHSGRLFEMAATAGPTLIVLEDLDLVLPPRRNLVVNDNLGELLNALDGVGRRPGIFLLATTNDLAGLDEALTGRPGRIDRVIEIGAAPAGLRRHILAMAMRRHTGAADDHLLDALVNGTGGWTVAELQELERTAVLEAAFNDTPPDFADALARTRAVSSPRPIGFAPARPVDPTQR